MREASIYLQSVHKTQFTNIPKACGKLISAFYFSTQSLSSYTAIFFKNPVSPDTQVNGFFSQKFCAAFVFWCDVDGSDYVVHCSDVSDACDAVLKGVKR